MDGKLHDGHRKRLKEKYLYDPNTLTDAEFLELLLFYAVPRKNTNEIAKQMIEKFGTLADLCEKDPVDISNACEVSVNTAILLTLVSKLSKRTMVNKKLSGTNEKINTPEAAGIAAIKLFSGVGYEEFYILCLNSQKRINNTALVQKGTLNEVPVYPRLIVELALRHKAHSVILTHNHPGGSLLPSQEDINITKAIQGALETISITVNDHIIVAGDSYLSMKQQNYM